MDGLKQDLCGRGLSLIETHISLVFLGDERVYKVKKPVNLGFLDFTTLAARKAACQAEVELNRRLAPEIYLGVLPIARRADGTHELAGDGTAVEWAVEMRRLPDDQAAEQRLARGALERSDIAEVAKVIARFHAGAACDERIAKFGERAAIEHNVRENFEQTRDSAPRFLSPDDLAALEAFQLGVLSDPEAPFERRIAQGRIRDGHGDLRLEHVYFRDGEIAIIDCIEFNERFRYADVAADLAFLSMDLEWHERHDLAEALLAAYARESNDYDIYSLVDFYESYRAYVRGKVSSFLADDEGAEHDARERARTQARKYYLLAEACAREPLTRPALYAVGGVIASGKSTVSAALGEALGAPVIDADRTRKHLAHVVPTERLPDAAFEGHYSSKASEQVYDELMRRAEVVLRSRRPVVLDASFRARAYREKARALAERLGVPFLFVECSAPPEVARQRLRERARGPSVSDGREAIFDSFLASYEPPDELPDALCVRIDTGAAGPPPIDKVLNR